MINDFFVWNGVNSKEKGLHVASQPARVLPMERESTSVIPGRGGSLTTLQGVSIYDDIVLTASCWVDNESRIPEICRWLRGNGSVTFGNRQEGYYHARINNQISFDKLLADSPYRTFSVAFRCNPYFYLLDSPETTLENSGTFLENPGIIYSEPILKITLTGNAEITVGATIFQLVNETGELTVDSSKLECSKGILPANDKMIGEFPTIPPAGAAISWTGGVSAVKVQPNWRTL